MFGLRLRLVFVRLALWREMSGSAFSFRAVMVFLGVCKALWYIYCVFLCALDLCYNCVVFFLYFITIVYRGMYVY